MKRTFVILSTVAILLIGILVGCAQPAPTATPLPPTQVLSTPTLPVPILEVIGPEGSTSFSLADLKALPVTEGLVSAKNSTGKISSPASHKGVALKDLLAATGGFGESMGVNVMAQDGYGMTFSYDQVMNGTFTVYDAASGDELKTHDPVTAVLAYERDGQPLDEEKDGTLRLVIVSAKDNQVADAHWSVKWVTELEIKPLGKDWTLHLEGKIAEEMDRGTFESGAAPNCHGTTWKDDHAQEWKGIPLWLMVGRIDDEIKHDGPAFNEALADAGYTVDVIASDGYTVSFDSARIKRNNDILVAYLVNGNPLPDKHFPLRLVGDDLQKNEMVGTIAEIVLHINVVSVPTPAPEPTATPVPATFAVEGDLVIVGLVDEPLGLTEADLREMDVVQVTVEHPKKGQQEYEGVRLNALLDQAGVQADAKKLVITADDGYSGEVFVAEVRDCADCLVALTEDPGTFRMVMPDLPSNVWIKGVVKLEIK